MDLPVCSNCKSTEAVYWSKDKSGVVTCENCTPKSESFECEEFNPPEVSIVVSDDYEKNYKFKTIFSVDEDGKIREVETPGDECSEASASSSKPKESKRMRFCKRNKQINSKNVKSKSKITIATKSKGSRRSIFKRNVMRAPSATATPTTSEFVIHRDVYYQIGDIVSMVDVEGGTYYAQIRGFLTDQYCDRSAAVTWLLPTHASPDPEEGFDPATYIIGPEEDIPRKLDFMEFICHAPTDYFKKKRCVPYLNHSPGEKGWIYTRLSPCYKVYPQKRLEGNKI